MNEFVTTPSASKQTQSTVADADTWVKVDIPITLDVVVDADQSFLESSQGRALVGEAVEIAILDLATTLSGTPSPVENWVAQKRLSAELHQEKFPYLRWPDTLIVFEQSIEPHFLTARLDLTKSLIGQGSGLLHLPIGKLKIVSRTFVQSDGKLTDSVEPLFQYEVSHLILDTISFEQGSTKAKSTLVFFSTLMGVVTLAASLSTVYANTQLKNPVDHMFKMEDSLTRAGNLSKNTPCQITVQFQVSLSHVMKEGGRIFDYKARDLSPQEAAQSVCYLQLALRLATGKDLEIDGIYGPRTEKVFREWADANKLKANIQDPIVQERLLGYICTGLPNSLFGYFVALPAK